VQGLMKHVHHAEHETNDFTKQPFPSLIFLLLSNIKLFGTTVHSSDIFLQPDSTQLQNASLLHFKPHFQLCRPHRSRHRVSVCIRQEAIRPNPIVQVALAPSMYILSGERVRVSATCGIFQETLFYFLLVFPSHISQTHTTPDDAKPAARTVAGTMRAVYMWWPFF
jgi:hypothetical protein